MTALSLVLLVALPAQDVQAFRLLRTQRGGANATLKREQGSILNGSVDGLYTWGAPMVTRSMQSNPRSADGCWKGLRMFNVDQKTWNGIWNVDPVPPILVAAFWKGHPKMEVARMSEDGKIDRKPCGWTGWTIETPKVSLHKVSEYIERWGETANTEDEWLSTLTHIVIQPSYLYVADEVAKYIKPWGWRICGSAHENEKVSHLLQDPQTLNCVITFQGTKNPMDWWDNLQFGTAPFCGLPVSVHQGFRSQMRWMTGSETWQANVRSKLGKCNKVYATGHSLGGAIATLFTMCVAQAPPPSSRGYVDFQKLGWKQETPELLDGYDPK